MKISLTRNVFVLSILLVGLSFLAAIPAHANDADRAYIRSKLAFFFVANPNDAAAASVTVDVDSVLKNTGTGVFYTDATLAVFRNMIKAMLSAGPVANAGNLDDLQQVLASTLKITGKPIAVYLVDDKAKVTNQANMNKFGICLDDNTSRQVWPCASAYTENDREKHAWGGNLTLGSWHYINTFSVKEGLSTACHEMMHTQDLSDMRLHIFGAFMYGNDQSHYSVEATPDMALTYMEGIANFAAFWANPEEVLEAKRWFSSNDYLIVEKVLPPGEKAPELMLYKELQKTGIAEISPAPAGYSAQLKANYAFYRIRSLPAKVIAQNEQVVAMALHTQAFYTSFDNVMAAIKEINPSTYRVSTSAWAQLISRLCTRALPLGRTVEQLGKAEYKEPKKYFLPLAICDYYTSFRSANKQEFKTVFENLPTITPWVDAYWDSGARDDVRKAVDPNAPKVGDVTDMAIALGITNNRQ